MSDPITILGISTLSAVLALIVMGSLARNGIPGSREWCWANATLAIGMVLALTRATSPAILSIVLANAAIGATALLQLVGMRRFFRRHTNMVLLSIVYVGMVCLIIYFQYVNERFALRVLVFSVYHAGMSFALGTTVFLNRPPERPKYAYAFMIGIAYASAVVNAVRGVVYLMGIAPPGGPLTPTPLHVFFLGVGTMAAPALTIGMVMMAHDRMSAILERHANIDYLTDLPGRRAFIERAANECARAQRFVRPLTIAILDIDFFKQINDSYGHAGGDDVLVHFAALLRSSTRASDTAGRIGGEEFALLLPETSGLSAHQVLERVRDRLSARPCVIGQRQVICTFSAGVAQMAEGESLDSLMERADRALYRAKQGGRDQTVHSQKHAIGVNAAQSPEPGRRQTTL
jgi:diguanylate cyclase (GGDEF)-like protein